MDASHDVSFDGWTFRPSTGELVRDGTCVRLPIQSARVLGELLSPPGELVTREALIATLWSRGVVDFDTALNTIVHRLRVALGDHADHPRYIETIPRRGYRFVGSLTVGNGQAAPASRVQLELAPKTEPRAAESAPDPAAVAGPRADVGPRPRSPRAFGIGTAAAATLVLTLVATAGFTGLERSPDPRGRTAAVSSRGVSEPVARARFLMQRREPGDVESARRGFLEAIAVGGGTADAWAGLASTWWLDVGEGRMTDVDGLPRAIAAAERALALDAGQVEAHVRLYQALLRGGDARGAAKHLRQARQHGPDHPLVLACSIESALGSGRLDEAIDASRHAVSIEPLAVATRQNLYVLLVMADRLDEAALENERIGELTPDGEWYRENRAELLVLRGRYDEALNAADALADGPARRFYRAVALHGLGRSEESNAELKAMSAPANGDDRVRLAEALAFRGERAAALELLERCADPALRCNWRWTRYSPYLRSLRDEPVLRSWVRSKNGHDVG